MGKALHGNSKHAQEQSLTLKGWLYSDGTLIRMEETSPSRFQQQSELLLFSKSLLVSPLLLI